jgi:hypothetical protein
MNVLNLQDLSADHPEELASTWTTCGTFTAAIGDSDA